MFTDVCNSSSYRYCTYQIVKILFDVSPDMHQFTRKNKKTLKEEETILITTAVREKEEVCAEKKDKKTEKMKTEKNKIK